MRVLDAELAGYVRCPLSYYYDKGIDRQSLVLKKVARYLFYSLMDESPASWRNFANKFLALWQEEGFDIEAGRKRFHSGDQGMLERLYTFYVREVKRKQTIVAVGRPYEVEMDGHTVFGEIDLVRETERGLEIADFRVATALDWALKLDVEIACKSYAFRSLYGIKESAVAVYCFPALPEKTVKVGHSDYLRAAGMITILEQAVAGSIFYPRPSAYCLWCSCRRECRQWPAFSRKGN